MMTAPAIISCLLALAPAVLFMRNLALYRPLPPGDAQRRRCSVLIPARDEEANIAGALSSVLGSTGIDFEVVVLDDGSSDRTAEIVREFALRDPRVRLEISRPLPAGWCGKNFACQQLAELAREPLLMFMDADVRITDASALARLACFVETGDASLVSGIPLEETHTVMERLIIPLIHFVLLGFLPLERMRRTTDPSLAAACGQILAVRQKTYQASGGHEAVAGCIHDALALARSFRRRGFVTDLFDATDTFRCRMYRSAAEVWHGFAKNAHEGLASPRLILPVTLLLMMGQVLPLVFFVMSPGPFELIAVAAAFAPRFMAAARFRQSLVGALLHPVGVFVLLGIQWHAFFRSLRRRPSVWKGRVCSSGLKFCLLACCLSGHLLWADTVEKLPNFQLADQFEKTRSYRFPKDKVTVMTVADHKGSEQLEAWISRIYERRGKQVDIDGIADVSMIPSMFQGMFRTAFQKQLKRSVMLDWKGGVVKQFGYQKDVANIYVIDRQGRIKAHASGQVSEQALDNLVRAIDHAIR